MEFKIISKDDLYEWVVVPLVSNVKKLESDAISDSIATNRTDTNTTAQAGKEKEKVDMTASYLKNSLFVQIFFASIGLTLCVLLIIVAFYCRRKLMPKYGII